MHLSPENLVDIAEGTRLESASPHLSSCDACRAQLGDLRAMLSAARDADVPEPSPLFWDHLSSRVSEAVAAEAANARLKGSRSFGELARELVGARGFQGLSGARAFQASVAAAAALLLAVGLGSRVMAPAPAPPPPSVAAVTPPAHAAAEPAIEQFNDWAPEHDASLTLVASLTDDVDMDTVREAGLAPRGSAEHAVTHLSDAELRELRRLLNEELTRPGA
jgi:hypothetical protein